MKGNIALKNLMRDHRVLLLLDCLEDILAFFIASKFGKHVLSKS